MSYYYDELIKISQKDGMSLKEIAKELSIPYSTIIKWKERNPSPRYIPKLKQFISKHNLKSINEKNSEINSSIEINSSQSLRSINYDKDGIPEGFWDQLERVYKSHNKGEQDWLKESEALKQIIKSIAVSIKPRYNIQSPIQHGGVSMIIKVHDIEMGISRALKFPRPIEDHQELFINIVRSEINHLMEATHQNIIEIFDQGNINYKNNDYPYYIMEYINGATDGLEYFTESKRTSSELINILKQVLDGIRHLHKLKIVHLDIKPENILISPDGHAVLSDLGSARKLTGDDDYVLIIATKGYIHPELTAKRFGGTTDPNRIRGEVKRSELNIKYDIYSIGKTILRFLDTFDTIVTERMPPYDRKYLHLLGCRALDGCNAEEPRERALSLPRTAFSELKYQNINDIINDIMKLTGEYPISRMVPEIDQFCSQSIQTSGYWKTTLTDRLIKTINHPSLQRLSGISQLGLIIQVYPTATHTRLEHALGTFTNTAQYINALYNDPINPLFRQIMNKEDITACLLAALCHDIGHYPLAHDLQEALPDIFNHEKISSDILSGKENWLYGKSLREIIINDWGIDSQAVADILTANPTITDIPIKSRIMHTIIDGPIDADKLDYLIRDSQSLGVPYGNNFDLNRLLGCLTIVFKEREKKLYVTLGIHEKGKICAESIAFARYAMFGTIYWHHTVRASVSMLNRAIWETIVTKYTSKQSLRNMFREFIDIFIQKEGPISIPMQLPVEGDNTLRQLTQILPSDRQVLQWFFDRTNQPGKQLLNMLNNRELFKRILVISFNRNERLWNMLLKYRRKSDYQELIDLQNEIQKRIIDKILKLDEPQRRQNSILIPENTDQIIALNESKEVLITIDIPIDRPGSKIPLEYLPESERQNVLQQWTLPNSLEDSIVWIQLHEHFTESVGKIRVFAHPQISKIIQAAIDREQLEEIVEASVQYLQ
jgi:HD superfamily phosphohydrolase